MPGSWLDRAYDAAYKVGQDPAIQLTGALLSIALGALAIYISVVLYKRQQKAARRRKINFVEMIAAAKRLSTKARSFNPNILFSCDSRGELWADIIAERMNTKASVFVGTRCHQIGRLFRRSSYSRHFAIAQVGQRTPKEVGIASNDYLEANCHKVETSRWMLYIPNVLRDFNTSRVLIVDDYSYTGETASLLKKAMVDEFGFRPNNVKTMTIVTTGHARALGRLPDFYDIVVDAEDFDLPYMSRE